MSRAKGHNGEAAKKLERDENNQFALTRIDQDLRLVRLRVEQALKRGGSRELLEPALVLVDEIKERIDRVRGA